MKKIYLLLIAFLLGSCKTVEATLCVGRNVAEVISILEGIKCGPRPTSCPDQLAKALKQAL